MVGSVNPRTKGYSTDGLPVYQYDPDRAKQLLAQAGHPDGLTFDLTVANTVPDLIDAAVLMKSYAAAAGITINVVQQSAAAFAQGRQLGSFQALMYRKPLADPVTDLRADDLLAAPQQHREPLALGEPGLLRRGERRHCPDRPARRGGRPLLEPGYGDRAELRAGNLHREPAALTGLPEHRARYTYRSENAVDFANLKFSSPTRAFSNARHRGTSAIFPSSVSVPSDAEERRAGHSDPASSRAGLSSQIAASRAGPAPSSHVPTRTIAHGPARAGRELRRRR